MAVTSNVKRKKKVWVPMYAPEFLNKAFLGESLVSDREAMVGKSLTLNLSIFTRDMKKQSTDVTFRVKSIVEGKGLTEIVGVALTNSYVKRLVRRGKSKVEDSFTTTTKDGFTVRIKPVVITNNLVNAGVATRIRALAKEELTNLANNEHVDSFFEILLAQKVQKELKDKLSKIYPLRYVDVRVAQIVLRKSSSAKRAEKEATEVVEPVAEQ
jgi:small subunit ribosomal protein S3Ae